MDLSTAPPHVEDIVDQYVYRPTAARAVDALIKTPVTPNQITLISTIVGLIGSFAMLEGSYRWIVGGLFAIQVSILIDCMDGQLARAKKMTSEWGDIFDHTSDDMSLVVTTAVLGALLAREQPASSVAVQIIAAFASLLFVTTSQYYYHSEYSALRRGEAPNKLDRDIARITMRYHERPWSPGHAAQKCLLGYFWFRMNVIRVFIFLTNPKRLALGQPPTSAAAYYGAQWLPLRLWSFGGLSSIAVYIFLFGAADALEHTPRTFYLGGTLFFIVALALQRAADRRLGL